MQTFLIQPAGWRSFWLFVPIGLVLAGSLGVVALSLWGARASRFEVSSEGLRLVGDSYGRMIPAGAIRAVDARRVDLNVQTELRPGLKTMGTGLPGYRAGWFRLRNGEKALVYLTDSTKAVYIPTDAGYSVIVSPAEPDMFLSAVHAMSGHSTPGS